MQKQSGTAYTDIVQVKTHRWQFLFILTLISIAGLVGSDVYLPTIPEMGIFFNQTAHAMQLTLAVFLCGLSSGQLVLGPLTDRFGRKKLLVLGMGLYFAASIACALSHSYTQLLAFRFIQAIGACSGLIIGRAIVGDVFDVKESGKIFSTIFPFVGMSPAVSPVIGGFLGHYFGWQGTFVFIGLFALLSTILIVYKLPETHTKEARQPIHIIKVISAYPRLLLNRKFVSYAAAPCFAYVAYFGYLAQSPFIFHSHGFGERAIGTFYISLALTYVAGNLTGKKLLNHFTLDRVLSIGFIAFNIGALLFLICGLLNLSLATMVFSISILTFGNGFLIPLGTAGVVSSFSKSAGYASGLLGFLQLGCAALSSSIVGIISQNSILNLGIYILLTSLVGALIYSALKDDGLLKNSQDLVAQKTN